MNFLRSTRGKFIVGTVLVLLLFLIRPGAQSLRIRIVRSVGLALGRPVDVGWVTLRLLPQPGFDLQDFVVHEDPEFGSEPVLRSSDVVAILRVSSLFRGRLEIARLSLTEPSINLVRNAEGRWNLEKLVERAATTPVAPTAKARSEARPGFPYIEADHGRINFKFGQEKKPYALTDANFALWQASENTWGMRLKAQPMRSDFNLSDTGLIDIDGSWQRSASLHETPVKFTVQWEGSQLGQLTKLTLGEDKGWRGTVRFSATLAGTPKDLTVLSENSIDDFRRYDISSNKSMRLAARCSGHYSTTDHILSAIACRAPVGDGEIVLSGSLAPMPGARACNLTMLAHQLPVQPLVEFARRIKKNVPADIVASGKVNANVALSSDARRPGSGPEWRGGGEVMALDLRSQITNTKLVLDKIPFALSSLDRAEPQRKSIRVQNSSRTTKGESMQAEARVEVGPFNLSLGRTNSATVRGVFSRSGYIFQVQGDAEVQHLLEAARTIGLPAPQSAATGEARINLNVAGNWAGFAAAAVTGNGQLHAVRARVRGLNESVEINSADVTLTPTSAQVRNLVAFAAGNNWRGTLTVPRQCDTPSGCVVGFDLHADEFVSDDLSRSVAAVPGKQPWYSFLSSSPTQSRPYLASLHAVGKLSANRALIHNLVASRVSAEVELDHGQLRLSKLRADVLGGRHSGEWRVDFTVNPPAYRGSGTLEKIVLGQIADAMQDNWITGTANVAYSAGTLGWTRSDLLAQADASFEIEARDGSLPHLTLAGDSASLHVNRFDGRLLLRDGKFKLEQSKLQTPVSIYQVSGTATLDRILDIKMKRDGARSINITGTLKEPHVVVSSTPETQAALKP